MKLKIKEQNKNDKFIYRGRIIDFSMIDEKDYIYYFKLFPNSFYINKEKKEKVKKVVEEVLPEMIPEEIFFGNIDGKKSIE
jgi:hypothetical protein